MHKKLFLGVALFFVSNVASATPTVDGTTISWPDDGWYQVQDATSYTEVCAGGRSCSVAQGTYTVINHSTGERFRGIRVGAGESISTVVVSGSTISWPDNGWYQVQDETMYLEVCGGGRSCSVEQGSYTVINHTTGSRYENVIVGEDNSGGDDGSDLIDDGNNMEVSSPDNLRLAGYSLLSGELMWDRAPASGNISQYEIARNGNVVGITDGTSWFEGDVKIGSQAWEVVAINSDGVRSEPARYPGSGSVDEILTQAEQLVDDIRLAFNLAELDEAVAYSWRMANTARQLSQGIESAEFQINQTNVFNTSVGLTGTQFDCDSGNFFAHVQGNYAEKLDGEPNGFCSGPEGSICEINVIANACVVDRNQEISGSFRFEARTGYAGTNSENVYLIDYQLLSEDEGGVNAVTMERGSFELYNSYPALNINSARRSTDVLNVIRPDSTRTVEEQYVLVTKKHHEDEFSEYSAWAYLPDTLFGGENLFVTFTAEEYSAQNGFAQIGEFNVSSSQIDRRQLIIKNSSDRPDNWDLMVTVNDTVQSASISTTP